MRFSRILPTILATISLSLPACDVHKEEHHEEHHKIVLTGPQVKDVTVTQPYVCQIHAKCNIEVSALVNGRIEEIHIKEGQAVKQGDVMFKLLPVLFQSRLDAESARVKLAEIKLYNTEKLAAGANPVVSQQDVEMHKAELAEAKAKQAQAKAELTFTDVKAQFDGIVDRLLKQQGTAIKEGETLTSLTDNSLMWVYFNVPEARYLEYKALQGKKAKDNSRLELVDSTVELVLADGTTFDQSAGNTVTLEGKFNNETGTIPFRADFPNPDGILRHGQTGTVLIHHKLRNAIVIPQRATFEILDKQYVWVVGEDHKAHQRPITIAHELEDIYVIKSGLGLKDKIVLEGVQQVHENDKLEDVEFEKPGEALANQKYHAE